MGIDPQRWQFSLRQLFIVTAMAAVASAVLSAHEFQPVPVVTLVVVYGLLAVGTAVQHRRRRAARRGARKGISITQSREDAKGF